MATTQLYSFASVALPTGQTLIPVTPVTGYTQSLSIRLTQAIQGNSNTTVAIVLQVSYDGGVTYSPGGASTHTGQPLNMGADFSYSQVPTHLQGTITVTSGPILLAGSITVQ